MSNRRQPKARTPRTVDEVISQSGAELPTCDTTIVIDFDAADEISDLEVQLKRLRAAKDDDARYGEASKEEQIAELEQKLKDVRANCRTMVVTSRAMSFAPWLVAVEQHPPVKDNKEDQEVGVHGATFFPFMVRECLIDPVVDNDLSWEKLCAVIPAGEWEKLVGDVWRLNRRRVNLPN